MSTNNRKLLKRDEILDQLPDTGDARLRMYDEPIAICLDHLKKCKPKYRARWQVLMDQWKALRALYLEEKAAGGAQ